MKKRPAIAAWRQYPAWTRGPAETVGDLLEGEIVLDRNRAEHYSLNAGGNRLFDFANLSSPGLDRLDEREVVSFVRRYGLLRHGSEEADKGICREPLMDFWLESRILAVLMNLCKSLQDSVRSGNCSTLRLWVEEAIKIGFDAEPEFEDDALMEQASVYLAEVISHALEGSSLLLTSTTQLNLEDKSCGHFVMTHKYPDLLAAIYGDFATTVANRVDLSECPGCGRFFVPESGKQKYHSKACASTNRWRRWKKSQAVQ